MMTVERITSKHRARLLLALWMLVAALCSSACTEAPTQIVVVVDPDPGVQTRLTAVQVTLRRNGEVSTFDAGRYEIPQHLLQTSPQDGHLVLRPRDPADTRVVVVTVTGLLNDGAQVSLVVATYFERGKTLYLYAPLVSACARISGCPAGTTCREGNCEAVVEQRLPDAPPAPRDAAHTTGVDLAPGDIVDATEDLAFVEVAQPDAPDVHAMDGPDAFVLSDATIAADRPGADTTVDRAEGGMDASYDRPAVDVDPATIAVPEPMAPLSTAIVTQRSPRFRWRNVSGIDGVELQVCADRACRVVQDTVVQDFVAPMRETSYELQPSADLPSGNWFWRLRGRLNGVPGSRASIVRQVRIPARSAAHYATGPTEIDLNGDGIGDAVLAYTDRVVLWGSLGMGLVDGTSTQTFARTGTVSVPGDLNQDGIVDLISASDPGLPQLQFWWGTESPSGLSPMPDRLVDPLADGGTGLHWQATAGRAGDVDGDGYADVVFASAARTVHLYDGRPDGSFAFRVAVVEPDMTHVNFGILPDTAGDFDGDGYADVVASGQGGNLCRIYFGGVDGIQQARAIDLNQSLPAGWVLRGDANPLGDVDGDGYFDVSCGAHITATDEDSQCVYFGGPAARTIVRRQCLDVLGLSFSDGGDVNQDGYSDVVLGAIAGTHLSLRIYLGGAGGVTLAPPYVSLAFDLTRSGQFPSVRVEDFNGDGRPDILLATSADGAFYFQNSATGFGTTFTRRFMNRSATWFAGLHVPMPKRAHAMI